MNQKTFLVAQVYLLFSRPGQSLWLLHIHRHNKLTFSVILSPLRWPSQLTCYGKSCKIVQRKFITTTRQVHIWIYETSFNLFKVNYVKQNKKQWWFVGDREVKSWDWVGIG